MNQLVVYVPASHLDAVKQALFAAGAGRYAHYDCCSWQVLGTGQFRPLGGSQPFIGTQNTLEEVLEYRLEMLCEDRILPKVIAALKNAHPYEEPAYHVLKMLDF